MTESDDKTVLLRAELSQEDWPNLEAELTSAREVRPSCFVLLESPFYAYGLSRGDTVLTTLRNGELSIEKVVDRSGHSTYRVLRTESAQEGDFNKFLCRLRDLGCVVTLRQKRLFSVDVPRKTDADEVYVLLEAGEKSAAWSFEEGHCGHPLKTD